MERDHQENCYSRSMLTVDLARLATAVINCFQTGWSLDQYIKKASPTKEDEMARIISIIQLLSIIYDIGVKCYNLSYTVTDACISQEPTNRTTFNNFCNVLSVLNGLLATVLDFLTLMYLNGGKGLHVLAILSGLSEFTTAVYDGLCLADKNIPNIEALAAAMQLIGDIAAITSVQSFYSWLRIVSSTINMTAAGLAEQTKPNEAGFSNEVPLYIEMPELPNKEKMPTNANRRRPPQFQTQQVDGYTQSRLNQYGSQYTNSQSRSEISTQQGTQASSRALLAEETDIIIKDGKRVFSNPDKQSKRKDRFL